MSKKQATEAVVYHLDWLKWALVVAILAAVAVGNSMYSNESLLYRVIVGAVAAAIAGAVAAQTKQGASFWHLARGSVVEVRRVVWPTKDERNKATLMVVLFVAFMSLVLWLLDLFFGWLASMLLG